MKLPRNVDYDGCGLPIMSVLWLRDSKGDPDGFELTVGDVVRVRGALNLSERVVQWDGRDWVTPGREKPRADETGGEKGVRGDVGAGPDAFAMQQMAAVGFPGEGLTMMAELDRLRAENEALKFGGPGSGGTTRLGISRTSADDGVADLLVRYLPDRFVDVYMQLVDLVMGPGNGYSGTGRGMGPSDNPVVGATKRGGLGSSVSDASESLNPISSSAKGNNRSLMASEWASIERSKVDAKLRKIAREVKKILDGSAASGNRTVTRKCGGRCGKFCDSTWLYCASCGGPTIDV